MVFYKFYLKSCIFFKKILDFFRKMLYNVLRCLKDIQILKPKTVGGRNSVIPTEVVLYIELIRI